MILNKVEIMSMISFKQHVQVNVEKQKKINDLVAKCIKQACANTDNLREVLRGDMKIITSKDQFSKVS